MTAPSARMGLSVRSYDPAAKVWRIYWMDSSTPAFGGAFTGTFAAGRGDFYQEQQAPHGPRRVRISFFDITTDAFEWELASWSAAANRWTPLWKMHMRRREPRLGESRARADRGVCPQQAHRSGVARHPTAEEDWRAVWHDVREWRIRAA